MKPAGRERNPRKVDIKPKIDSMHNHIKNHGGLGGKVSGAGGGGFLFEIIEKSKVTAMSKNINQNHMLKVKHEPLGSRLLSHVS